MMSHHKPLKIALWPYAKVTAENAYIRRLVMGYQRRPPNNPHLYLEPTGADELPR